MKMETTQQKFSADYGVNQGTVSFVLRRANTNWLYKRTRGVMVYDEKDVAEALKQYYKDEAQKLRDRAVMYVDKASAVDLKFEKRCLAFLDREANYTK